MRVLDRLMDKPADGTRPDRARRSILRPVPTREEFAALAETPSRLAVERGA